uniref:Ig-like domain-containing protein n=1 Tax=Anabas testudineus TaxID=64144 RepID=A0A3Q1IMZ0_ANATE
LETSISLFVHDLLSLHCFHIHIYTIQQVRTGCSEPGDTVTLPCGVHSNISIIVVEWSRTDLETEYVFLQRGSRSESFNEHESFKNRVELKDREKKDGDVSLILRNVTFNDTGTYECRVVQRRTNHRKSFILETDPINIINLRVVEPGELVCVFFYLLVLLICCTLHKYVKLHLSIKFDFIFDF